MANNLIILGQEDELRAYISAKAQLRIAELQRIADKKKKKEAPKIKRRKKSYERQKFLRSPEWKAARALCLGRFGSFCQKCGSSEQINVDHIKPKSKFPELALVQSNLRPLCWPCNRTKAAKIE